MEILIPLIIGGIFGAGLVLASLADPDKIIGTLRLKDFHAMRVIAVFVLVGMAGTWILQRAGYADFNVKTAVLLANLIGGSLLGLGFGMTGFCPGTGLACAASGRIDALVSVLGMFAGALGFLLMAPYVVPPIESVLDYGGAMLPEMTGTPRAAWVVPIVLVGALVLWLTRPRARAHNAQDTPSRNEE
ncbi:MAG: DUF6691 family protein [Phycisphaerae bacterium]